MTKAEPPPCGTWEAYRRHVKNREYVDPACREACRLRAEDRRLAAARRAVLAEVAAQTIWRGRRAKPPGA